MNDKQKAAVAWILFGLVTVFSAAQLLFELASQSGELSPLDIIQKITLSLILVAFALVGALIASRQPRNVIGLLLILPALLSIYVPLETYANQLTALPQEPSLALLGIMWLTNWGWLLLIMPILFILVLFPTGKPFTPRWRFPIYLGLGMSLLFILLVTFGSELRLATNREDLSVPNPIGFIPSAWEENFIAVWYILMPLLTILCAAALFVRFRRARMIEREQIKWLLYAGALFAVIYAFSFTDPTYTEPWWQILTNLSLLAIPLAIGVAILRYHLFDIDIIIRRTLVYGVLTALLIAVYFGVVLVAQSLFVALTGQESPLVIVISTLIIAALFNPLRRWVQSFIDRRFFRQQYDRQQVLAQFSQSARDEVQIESLTADLQRIMQETMQPESLSIWLKETSLKRGAGG